jgi:hypothetical protein
VLILLIAFLISRAALFCVQHKANEQAKKIGFRSSYYETNTQHKKMLKKHTTSAVYVSREHAHRSRKIIAVFE